MLLTQPHNRFDPNVVWKSDLNGSSRGFRRSDQVSADEEDPSKVLLSLLHRDQGKASPKAASESARTESTMSSTSELEYSDDDLDRYFEAQKQMLELGLQRALLEEHGDSVDRQVLDQACHELVDRTFREVETARADEIDPRTNRYMKRAEDLSD
ncbi:hypothetical protein Pmar_PMAR010958 [Perkinsus marinus ATCC 50983]|uniref:Uncharacterized protein n=1 Tax=Perkinsus marinus (strain ATCC 50983 / TXsc) TaxID=423536 RepID=C5LUG2_PERM5|nr:hypothetical protein Pmar_PMAR010958 [Perkinsus marinus ATCC 50983]EEQ99695.1 hypothetical protein Pmar_PMAR010958 [Perkinsus marinus ATCC 50983]|mmetsp:Transcript_5037/g.4639  ORF Transcript_5037/g.4639 Transcript_5037/m.4639 type:complete len:155 (-) Transcript_5037:296-760(-)|eukprot:XP_002766978.1 hypothetical protein Pmar_PMAR010958 [Perkinsus marinus ATCC 50983]